MSSRRPAAHSGFLAAEPSSLYRRLREERLVATGQHRRSNQGRSEAGNCSNRKRPARAEVVCYPTHDRSAERHASECNAHPEGHHPAPHRWFCGELHEAVGASGKCHGSCTHDGERCRKPPIARRHSSQSTSHPENTGSYQQICESWLFPDEQPIMPPRQCLSP